MIGSLTGSYLTRYGARGAIVPDVAAIVPTFGNGGISRDGRSITFHLRRDVRWQDGAPLTARDLVFTYDAIANPSNSVPSRDGYDHVAGVHASDLYTVVVRLRQPYAPIIPNFFGGDSSYTILPAHLLAGYASLDRAAYNAAPIASGPYLSRAGIAAIALNSRPTSDTTAASPRSGVLSYARSPTHRRFLINSLPAMSMPTSLPTFRKCRPTPAFRTIERWQP